MDSSNKKIQVRNLKKNFGKLEVLKDISIDISEGEVVVLLGPSGSGKSTFLRCVNQLETVTAGSIIVDGVDVTDKHTDINKVRENIGMVFQHFNLFPHMTVLKNITLAPVELKKLTQEQAEKKGMELLARVGLADKAGTYPNQLSGGQKQRVAIARALANDPKVLLCDEATSALDPKTTRSILKLLREVNQRLGITIVVITHQMSVVKYICDRAAVMEKGRVVEEGTILEIFSHPKMPVTKGFIDTATNVDDLYELLEETRSGDGVNHGQTVYLLTYTGSSAGKPLMVELYQRFGVEANIIFGNVELLKGTPLGKLAVTLSGTPESVGDALEFIRSQNVVVEAL